MKLIKLQDKFILVSDDEIKKNDWGISKLNEIVQFKKNYENSLYKKIIAGITSLPSIDFSLLSETDCKTIGFIDVEKLADAYVNSNYPHYLNPKEKSAVIEDIKWTYNKVQSLNDKMFSLEDIDKIIEFARYTTNSKEYIIQSLQKTEWDVEVNENNQIIKLI